MKDFADMKQSFSATIISQIQGLQRHHEIYQSIKPEQEEMRENIEKSMDGFMKQILDVKVTDEMLYE